MNWMKTMNMFGHLKLFWDIGNAREPLKSKSYGQMVMRHGRIFHIWAIRILLHLHSMLRKRDYLLNLVGGDSSIWLVLRRVISIHSIRPRLSRNKDQS